MHNTQDKKEQKERINKIGYYLLCGLIIALGLYFIFQGFAALF